MRLSGTRNQSMKVLSKIPPRPSSAPQKSLSVNETAVGTSSSSVLSILEQAAAKKLATPNAPHSSSTNPRTGSSERSKTMVNSANRVFQQLFHVEKSKTVVVTRGEREGKGIVNIREQNLEVVECIKYSGSEIMQDARLDKEISRKVQVGSTFYQNARNLVWNRKVPMKHKEIMYKIINIIIIISHYPSVARTPARDRINTEIQHVGTSSFKTPIRTPRSRTPKTSSRTPNSTTSRTSDRDSCCIMAISEGRGMARGEVGIAALDTRCPHLILCQISDNQTYHNTLIKINVLNPVEIIVPHTFCEGQHQNKLFTTIKDTFPGVTLTTVQRRHFSDVHGLQQIKHFCAPEYASVEMLVMHKFYALSSATALLKYVEHIQNMMFAPKSLKVEYQGSQNSTVIDVETSLRLELVRSLRGNGPQHSLMGILNNCRTSGGIRLLRANILQPPCSPDAILSRLDCVQEIVDTQDLYHNLQTLMCKFADVDRLLQLCMHIPQQDNQKAAETQMTYVLLLKTSLELLPSLQSALENVKSAYLCSVRESLNDERYSLMLQRILETIHDDAHLSKGFVSGNMQRCFAVKPHLNGLLDVARKAYCELVDDITNMVAEMAEEHNLPFKLSFTAVRGFHIQLSDSGKKKYKESDVPNGFIQIQKSRTMLSFTTQQLIHIDERCKDILYEIQMLSNVVVYKLLTDLREHIGCLYKLCENISELDMLVSFAKISAISNYTRPEFGKVLELKDSRHPILDFINPTEPVPNDVFASSDQNFTIITGPNMSGKSIYIRQILLLQIMAQVGCYIPASRAKFRIVDHIFSRIGFDDSIECNASTFVLEVKEVQYILQTMTSNSIVIMDELCRGTSSEEGTAVAWALAEEMLQSDAFIFLTTHFLLLTKLEELYSNVKNIHLETVERIENGKSHLVYTHRLQPGISQAENYGLRLAERLGMPDSIMEIARKYAQQITAEKKPTPVTGGQKPTPQADCELISALLQLLEEGNLNCINCLELKKHLFPGDIQDKLRLESDTSDIEELEETQNTSVHVDENSSQFLVIRETPDGEPCSPPEDAVENSPSTQNALEQIPMKLIPNISWENQNQVHELPKLKTPSISWKNLHNISRNMRSPHDKITRTESENQVMPSKRQKLVQSPVFRWDRLEPLNSRTPKTVLRMSPRIMEMSGPFIQQPDIEMRENEIISAKETGSRTPHSNKSSPRNESHLVLNVTAEVHRELEE
ncbi:mutS protein homolog 4-like [Anabrus simplex]|uniref:mutS protein homolog 4-like n=1 Tax=Anabrus simplex TaxID=316456 RepID=UPI0035A29BBC